MQVDIETYYRILEITVGASQEEIKQAYKDLVKVWHPDRFTDDPRLHQKAEAKLRQINAAYEFLKSYGPSISQLPTPQVKTEPQYESPQPQQSSDVLLSCEKLDLLLQLGRWKEADHETKRLLLQLTNRERDGWLSQEDVQRLSPQALSFIDQLWIKSSEGRFGFRIQYQLWQQLFCQSSCDIATRKMSEKKFGEYVHWHRGGRWLTPWDDFNYGLQAPPGSLPRDYIFALHGWWSFSKGWTGYQLLRFDDVFSKL